MPVRILEHGALRAAAAFSADPAGKGRAALWPCPPFAGLGELGLDDACADALVESALSHAEREMRLTALLCRAGAGSERAQRLCARYGFFPCALPLASQGEALFLARLLQKEEAPLYLPQELEALARAVFGPLELPRVLLPAQIPLMRMESELFVEVHRAARLGRAVFLHVGADAEEALAQAQAHMRTQGVEQSEILIRLNEPGAAYAYGLAATKGFCISGILPMAKACDMLCMQKPRSPLPACEKAGQDSPFPAFLKMLRDLQ